MSHPSSWGSLLEAGSPHHQPPCPEQAPFQSCRANISQKGEWGKGAWRQATACVTSPHKEPGSTCLPDASHFGRRGGEVQRSRSQAILDSIFCEGAMQGERELGGNTSLCV